LNLIQEREQQKENEKELKVSLWIFSASNFERF
jgi:hypothetical protein